MAEHAICAAVVIVTCVVPVKADLPLEERMMLMAVLLPQVREHVEPHLHIGLGSLTGAARE
jgi:hypothetical protein